MNKKTIILLSAYVFVSVLTYGHAFKDATQSCYDNAKSAKRDDYLMFCKVDVPVLALFNSLVHPLYWSYQLHKEN